MTGEAPAPVRVLLVGMMGVGKSTVGRAVAARTGWPYVDNDELVRRATGVPTKQVLDRFGEPALRTAESQALGFALALDPPVVAGVAAGVVEDPADRDRLRAGGHVVWLRATLDTLVRRVGPGDDRPWLRPDPRAALERLWAGRRPLYEYVATQVVDVDGAAPADIADEILAELARVSPPRSW